MKKLFIIICLFCLQSASAQITLNLKLFIEGYYNQATGLMSKCLYITGISSNQFDADSVTISLVEPIHLNVIETQKGILHTDGTVSLNFQSVSFGDSYFIKVKHRSAIETWSAAPVSLQAVSSYDFSTSSSQAFGNNLYNVGTTSQPVWAFYSGDISDGNLLGLGIGFQDGVTDGQDYLDMENALAINLSGYNCQDITGDGIVDSADYLLEESRVYLLIIAQYPYVNSIEEIHSNEKSSSAIKCISIDGKLLMGLHAPFTNEKTCIVFNVEGKFICQTPIETISTTSNESLNLPDGFYIIRIVE